VRLEQSLHAPRVDRLAPVAHADRDRPAALLRLDLHHSVVRSVDRRVLDQVHEHLRHLVRIGPDARVPDAPLDPDAVLREPVREHEAGALDDVGEENAPLARGAHVHREVRQQPHQAIGLLARPAQQPLAGRGRKVVVVKRLERRSDRRRRRPELVREHRQQIPGVFLSRALGGHVAKRQSAYDPHGLDAAPAQRELLRAPVQPDLLQPVIAHDRDERQTDGPLRIGAQHRRRRGVHARDAVVPDQHDAFGQLVQPGVRRRARQAGTPCRARSRSGRRPSAAEAARRADRRCVPCPGTPRPRRGRGARGA